MRYRELFSVLIAVRMLIERGGLLSLTAFLQDLAAGRGLAEAFERRFFLSYSDFQTAWEQRVRWTVCPGGSVQDESLIVYRKSYSCILSVHKEATSRRKEERQVFRDYDACATA